MVLINCSEAVQNNNSQNDTQSNIDKCSEEYASLMTLQSCYKNKMQN